MHKINMTEVMVAANALARALHRRAPGLTHTAYGVPRGGIPAALALASEYNKFGEMRITHDPLGATVIVDDLVDSGATFRRYRESFPAIPFAALFTKQDVPAHPSVGYTFGIRMQPAEWLIFPWEESAAGSSTDIIVRLLQYIGENPEREGLRDTPARVAKAWRDEWARGYSENPEDILKTFGDGGANYDELILVKDIPVYTHCEHHLAPFFGVAHVGYIPGRARRIVGLSKLSRLVDCFARRLQVQERLTTQIADALAEHLEPAGVGVVLQCRHLCMESRGIQRQGSTTSTSKLTGALMDKPEARAEFFAMIRGS